MAADSNESYQSYNTMVNQTSQGLAALEEVCQDLQMAEHVTQLQELQDRMSKQVFSVGIMGEFRRGKSTVINALLGAEIVPSDVVPTSATLNYVRWDATPRSVVDFKDGTKKEVPVEELTQYITKTTKENEMMAATVEDAKVYYPCRFCQNGVQIIDTPGLNDDDRMTAIAERVIPTLDAVVMVLTADIPFSASEAAFVRDKIMLSDLGRVIFVVNKMDYIRKKDRQRVLDTLEGRIQESVLEKMVIVYGEDSEEYKSAKAKMGNLRIYGISARDALDGRLEGDEELVEKSGILEFEQALAKLLTEERGMIELTAPVNGILSTVQQAKSTILMRRESLTMDQEKLNETCEEGMRATKEARDRVKEQIRDLKDSAAGLSQELLPDVAQAYQSVEDSLLEYVNQVSITADDVKSDKAAQAKAETVSQEIYDMTQQKLTAATQAMLVKMESRLGEDLARLGEKGEIIFDGMNKVQQKLATGGKKDSSVWVDAGVGMVSFAATSTIPIFGIGSLINGWKENGLPGALVGGGVGMATGAAVCYTAASVACLALGVASVWGIPFILLGSIAGNAAGKAALNKIFKKPEKQIEKLREQLRNYVKETMEAVRQQRSLENWVRTTTSDLYENVSRKLDEEVETTLMNFERQLVQLKADRQKHADEMEVVVAEMNELDEKLDKLLEQIRPVQEKLQEALTSKAA